MAESLRGSRDSSLSSGESLLALTRDPLLIETLTSVAPEHALHVVGNEPDLMEQLAMKPAGVAILDAAAAHTPLGELTQSLRRQFPDLVLIVAGGPADQSALSARVTEGTIYRFLHKPVSAQRVKLFVDAAWRRHDVEHAATGSFAALKIEPAASEPTLPRSVLWAGAAALAGVLALTLWRTLATSSAPSRPVAPAPTPAVARAETAAARAQREITALLQRADAALAAGALVEPARDNAAELYGAVLQRDPTNARARAGQSQVLERLLTGAEQALLAERLGEATRLTAAARLLQPDNLRVAFLNAQIAKEEARAHSRTPATAPAAAEAKPVAHARDAALLSQARTALAAGDLTEGERLLLAAADAGAAPEELAPLQRQLQTLRIAAKANAMTRSSDLFHQRLAQGQLLEPAGDSAKFYLEQLQASDPTHPTTLLARDALAARLIDEARKAIAQPDFAAAENWIAQARTTGAPAADLTAIEQALAKARTAASAPSVLTESQLRRVHYVEPDYPLDAERLGRRGAVELEFTVRPDGTVGDLTVTHSEPRGVFDSAALRAVRQWRYLPAERDGHPVAQRARVRVVFAP